MAGSGEGPKPGSISASELDSCIINEVLHGCKIAQNLQLSLALVPPQDLRMVIASSSTEIVAIFGKVLQLLDAENVRESQRELYEGSGFIPRYEPEVETLTARDKAETSRRRKVLPTRVEVVPIVEGGGGELPPDGFTWRKYGQKEILGARHPRSYFRCTHKYDQCCPAMKQVQREDNLEDGSSCFIIKYIGNHVCQGATLNPQSGTSSTLARLSSSSRFLHGFEEEDAESPTFFTETQPPAASSPGTATQLMTYGSVLDFSATDQGSLGEIVASALQPRRLQAEIAEGTTGFIKQEHDHPSFETGFDKARTLPEQRETEKEKDSPGFSDIMDFSFHSDIAEPSKSEQQEPWTSHSSS